MSNHVLSVLGVSCLVLSLPEPAHAQLIVGVEADAVNTFNAAVWRIEVASGERELLFPGGAGAIAVDDQGGRVFTANGPQLSVWNYGSGPAATLLGVVATQSGTALGLSGMAFGGGRLFAAKPSSQAPTGEWLYEIDLSTLIATPIATTPVLTWIEELSFDPASGLFYAQHDSGAMYSLDILGGGSPSLVASHGFGPDGGALGANGQYYITFDDGQPIRVFDLAANTYTSTSLWSPYHAGLNNAGADWAPSLQASTGPSVYCAPSPIGQGAHLRTLYSGAPSASAGSGFTITHVQIAPQSRVQPHFSLSGPANAPFFGGLRCVRVPVFRMPYTPMVSGAHVFDFNAYIASGANPALVAGQTVWLQLATQNALGASNGTFALGAGLRFTILP